jgi:hypothetical protein
MYYDTFKRLKLPKDTIKSTTTTFHGIVPGRKAYPVDKATIAVTFGTLANFRTERIEFEIVDYKSSYHCVLGRQTFTKFMAVPHYAYNMMKLPGPHGIIIVHGDPDLAMECETEGSRMAEKVVESEVNSIADFSNLSLDDEEGIELPPQTPKAMKRKTLEVIVTAAIESLKDANMVEILDEAQVNKSTAGDAGDSHPTAMKH